MGQKVNPNGFRLQIRRDWSSSWYVQGNLYNAFIEQDFLLRKLIYSSYKKNNCIFEKIQFYWDLCRGNRRSKKQRKSETN